jgi:hypothetical protein
MYDQCPPNFREYFEGKVSRSCTVRANKKPNLLQHLSERLAIQSTKRLTRKVAWLRRPKPTATNYRRLSQSTFAPLLYQYVALTRRGHTLCRPSDLSHQNSMIPSFTWLGAANYEHRSSFEGFFLKVAEWEEHKN